jgi:hypothetical protein
MSIATVPNSLQPLGLPGNIKQLILGYFKMLLQLQRLHDLQLTGNLNENKNRNRGGHDLFQLMIYLETP